MLQVAKAAYQTIVGTRRATKGRIAKFLNEFENARILELGSGSPRDGDFPYSFAQLAPPNCEVVRSDVNPQFGYPIVDVTEMPYENEFDGVICTNVLEHVWDVQAAINGIGQALKPEGRAFISIPMFFPLHDEPYDYWRITEHGLRRLFPGSEIRWWGWRRAPFAYFITLSKVPGVFDRGDWTV